MESTPSLQFKLRDYEIPIFTQFVLDARKKLGSGTFGDVYLGTKLGNREEQFAIKLETKSSKYSKNKYHSILKKEDEIYKVLKDVERIPKIHGFGDQGTYHILIIDLLGHSLKDLMTYIKSPFSLGTTLKLSLQILDILKEIHKKGIVLRYIKPGNMAMGRGINKDYVYLFDFGLAKKYIKNGAHIPYKENKDYLGNRDFISIKTHSGVQISRRDDIESLGYNLVYFMKGELPWSKLRKSEYIKSKKIETSLDELCEGLPEEFKEFIKYARNMEFTEEPDYEYLKNLLLKTAKKNNIEIDSVKYDWDIYDEKLNNNKNKKEKEIKENDVKSDTKTEEKKQISTKNCEEDIKGKEDNLIVVFDEKFDLNDE